MSLILDALNRAEQERNEKNHIPTLQSVHRSGDEAAPPLLQRLHLERWLIALVVGYLVFDFLRDRMPQPDVAVAPAAPQAQLQPAQSTESTAGAIGPAAGAQATAVAPVASAPAATRADPRASSGASQAAPVGRIPGPAAEVESAVAAKPAAGVADSAESVKPVTGRASQEQPGPDTKDAAVDLPATGSARDSTAKRMEPAKITPNPRVESLYRTAPDKSSSGVRSAIPALNNTAAATQGPGGAFLRAQQITDLSLELRHQIPSLKYNDHMPAARPADRGVVLNGNLYREGDTIVAGLRLIEISEPGIVLEFEGERFRLGAYNSWINFQ